MEFEIFGGVLIGGKEIFDDELLALKGKTFGLHGIDWEFAGDQFAEECVICVIKNDEEKMFKGNDALNQFIEFIS